MLSGGRRSSDIDLYCTQYVHTSYEDSVPVVYVPAATDFSRSENGVVIRQPLLSLFIQPCQPTCLDRLFSINR